MTVIVGQETAVVDGRNRRQVASAETAVPVRTFWILACLASAVFPSVGLAETPNMQQAIVQLGNGGPDVLHMQTVPVLRPGSGQILIRVYAAAVNPVDWKMRQGYKLGGGTTTGASLRIPGFDVAGVVQDIGDDVVGLSVGDPVFSMIGMIKVDGLNGGYAEYVLAPAGNVIKKPESVTFAEAAGLATVGMTALRYLNLAGDVEGRRLFIDGIAGGVGSSVAQVGKARGAYVIGTASRRHHAYLKTLGVDEIVDYTSTDFTSVVEPVDIFFETVNVDNAIRGLQILRPGGTLISVVGTPSDDLCARAGARCPNPGRPGSGNGASEGERLQAIADLAAQGSFSVNVDRQFPLHEAGAAQELNAAGHTQGKIVLTVSDKANDR